jgi:hypothetical protein
MMDDERTWNLLHRMAARFEDLEQVVLCADGFDICFPPLLKWLNSPKLKTLHIHRMSEWMRGPMELRPEVRILLLIRMLRNAYTI